MLPLDLYVLAPRCPILTPVCYRIPVHSYGTIVRSECSGLEALEEWFEVRNASRDQAESLRILHAKEIWPDVKQRILRSHEARQFDELCENRPGNACRCKS